MTGLTSPNCITNHTDPICSTCNTPVHTQFASPHLIEQIVYGGLDPAADPAWESSGAAAVEDYGRWCGHLCGVTCLRMALGRASLVPAPSLFELRDGALKYGAYTEDADGTIRGMIYAPLATYAEEAHALPTTVHRHLAPAEILELLDGGRTVMASVHYEIRNPDRPAPGRGGHLVLITARTADGDGVHFHNPSGTTPESRAADLPLATFERFFAGRGVSFTGAQKHSGTQALRHSGTQALRHKRSGPGGGSRPPGPVDATWLMRRPLKGPDQS